MTDAIRRSHTDTSKDVAAVLMTTVGSVDVLRHGQRRTLEVQEPSLHNTRPSLHVALQLAAHRYGAVGQRVTLPAAQGQSAGER